MHDPVVAEYARSAEKYDEKWAFYVDATTRETLRRMPMTPAARVLDVGCGTGELLMRLRAKYPDAWLAGLDPVAEMLDVARDKLSGKEDLRIGYADSLPWASGSFDVVVSCNMFHYISHPIEALREMARAIRPGGALVLTDWCDDYLACRICNLYLRLTNRAFYKTYRHAECLDLLHRAGFDDVTLDTYKISWLWGLMTAVVRI
ncbi:MAG TPA: class I SAM-dependent methyltransferase [Burkholderiales bacterium]|jgi:ubiquinone/menaquinone biosynthesis C-methylase UbiE